MALVGHISGSSQSNSIIGISGSVIVANRNNNLFPSFPGIDTTFFVSGSTDDTATAVFGGKLVVSGGIKTPSIINTGDLTIGGSAIVTGDLTVNGNTTTINTSNLEIKDALIGLGYASGSVPQSNGDRGIIGGLTTGDDIAIFWDNSELEFAVAKTDSNVNSSAINITSYANFHVANLTGSSVKASSLSGSLTKLSDGTDYLRGGSNISLTTGSSGEITIGVTGLVTAPQYFYSTTNASLYTTGSTAFIGNDSIDSPNDKGLDVWFYVSGSSTNKALFGGDIVTSGSLKVDGNTILGDTSADTITFNAKSNSSLLPASDMLYNLGSPSSRWANIYTGDLHLRNERGDWTVIEEETYLSIKNNKTGKLYRFVLEEVK